MKSQFSTFASRLAKSIFAASLCTLIISPHATSQSTDPYNTGGSANNKENHNPPPHDCCNCISITVGGTTPAKANSAGGSIPADPNSGDYNVEITVNVNTSDIDCDDVNLTSVTVRPVGQNGGGETYQANGKSFSQTVVISGDEFRTYGSEWEIVVECSGDKENPDDVDDPDPNKEKCTKRFKLGDPCGSCDEGACPPSASNGSFTAHIPIPYSQGMSGGILYYHQDDIGTFLGRKGLIARNNSIITLVHDQGIPANPLASINLASDDSPLLEFTEDTPNNTLTITHTDALGTSPFRTTTISLVETNGMPHLRMDSTLADGQTTRHEQSQPNPDTYVMTRSATDQNGNFIPARRETKAKNTSTPGVEIHLVMIEEYIAATGQWQTTSAIQSTWNHYLWGWEMTEEIIDPDRPGHIGAKLTSSWTYYQPGEITGLNGWQIGLGRLKEHKRHDGHLSFHTYSLHQEIITSPYTGDPAGKKTTTDWNPVARTRTITVEATGHILSKTTTQYTETTTSRTIETGNGPPQITITHYNPTGQSVLFGGRPIRIHHPDGTLTTYSYSHDGVSGIKTTTEQGATTDGEEVSQGTKTLTVTNSRGTTILSQTTAIGHGTGTAVFESMAVTKVDHLGRPETTAWFPSTVTVSAVGEEASATGAKWTTTTA